MSLMLAEMPAYREPPRCAACGTPMVPARDFEKSWTTSEGTWVISDLSGSRCPHCDSAELDAASVATLAATAPPGRSARFETSVRRAGGRQWRTDLEQELAGVLALRGHERLSWEVIDPDHVVIRVRRGSTDGGGARSARPLGRSSAHRLPNRPRRRATDRPAEPAPAH